MKQETRVDNTGEVFTPRSLIRNMLNRLPNNIWLDPNKTWLEPSAGDGNFLEEIFNRLINQGHDPRHILDNQIFSVELMDDNHFALQLRLGYIKLNDDWIIPGDLWDNGIENFFTVSTLSKQTIELNDSNNPYKGKKVFWKNKEYKLKENEVYHHINHLCGSFLDPQLEFLPRELPKLPKLKSKVRPWPKNINEIGEKITYISTLYANGTLKYPVKISEEIKLVIQDTKKNIPSINNIKKTKQEKLPKSITMGENSVIKSSEKIISTYTNKPKCEKEKLIIEQLIKNGYDIKSIKIAINHWGVSEKMYGKNYKIFFLSKKNKLYLAEVDKIIDSKINLPCWKISKSYSSAAPSKNLFKEIILK